MTRFIEHIVEPDRLLVSWQAPEEHGVRMRRFVAELIRRDDDADLVYLRNTEDFQKAKEQGFEEYTGFSVDKDHHGVLAAFMRRLPPRKRGDFDRFLTALRIKDATDVSDFALLGYSGAKLPDDGFVVVNPFDNIAPPFEFLLPIQGYRYYEKNLAYEKLAVGQVAVFVPEPDNKFDPEAIKIEIGGHHVGYVCRGLTSQLKSWLVREYIINASIERLNGTADRPIIFLYVEVRED